MRTFVALSVIAIVAVLAPATARAHFTLDQLDDFKPVSWMSQDSNGGPQKNGPCAATPNSTLGDAMGTPTHIVTGLMAGETVKITVTATIPHPGWYRVALMEGASASQSLTTIPDPMAMSGTNCTPAIMTNPVWSKTQPVIADGLPAGSVAKTTQMGTKVLTATIPQNANCTAASPCTIQVIMVMTDHPATDCYYHHCADITTDGSANTDGGMSTTDASTDARDGGMSMGGGSAMGGAAGGAKGSGGVVGTGGAVASGGVSGGSGGVSGSGGANASASGGSTATGGTSSSSGGVTASGGKTGSGGSSSSSGGNSSSSSGGSTGGGSGGSSGSGASGSSSGGCSVIPDGGGAPFAAAGASLLALLVARVRRRRR